MKVIELEEIDKPKRTNINCQNCGRFVTNIVEYDTLVPNIDGVFKVMRYDCTLCGTVEVTL